MRYIAPKLLPHTITVKVVSGKDADRNITYTESTVTGVRIGLTRGWSKGSEGFTSSDSMELISDANTTNPADFVPAVGMQILFNGNTYTIQSVKPCYTTSDVIHHYEATLV